MNQRTSDGTHRVRAVFSCESLEPRTLLAAGFTSTPVGPVHGPAPVYQGLLTPGGVAADVEPFGRAAGPAVAGPVTPAMSLAAGTLATAVFTVDSSGNLLVIMRVGVPGERTTYQVVVAPGGPTISGPGDVSAIQAFVVETRSFGLIVESDLFGALVTTTAGSYMISEDTSAGSTPVFTARPLASSGASLDIVGNTASFVTADGRAHVFGTSASGDLIVDYAPSFGGPSALANLSDQVRAGGQQFVAVAGGVTAFTTAWGAMNVAYLDASGEVQVVWWAAGLSRWRIDDLSAIAGAPRLHGNLVSLVSPWGGLNVYGADDSGALVALWWTPGQAAWAATPLFGGTVPLLETGTMTAYVVPWGGLNIAGLDAQTGTLTAYWWTPGQSAWMADVLAPVGAPTDFQLVSALTSGTEIGGLQSANDKGSIKEATTIAGFDSSGHIATVQFGLGTGLNWVYADLGAV